MRLYMIASSFLWDMQNIKSLEPQHGVSICVDYHHKELHCHVTGFLYLSLVIEKVDLGVRLVLIGKEFVCTGLQLNMAIG